MFDSNDFHFITKPIMPHSAKKFYFDTSLKTAFGWLSRTHLFVCLRYRIGRFRIVCREYDFWRGACRGHCLPPLEILAAIFSFRVRRLERWCGLSFIPFSIFLHGRSVEFLGFQRLWGGGCNCFLRECSLGSTFYHARTIPVAILVLIRISIKNKKRKKRLSFLLTRWLR